MLRRLTCAVHAAWIRTQSTPLDDARSQESEPTETPRSDSRHADVAAFLEANGAKTGMAIRMNAADDDPAGRLCAAAAKGDINQLRDLIEENGLDANTGARVPTPRLLAWI